MLNSTDAFSSFSVNDLRQAKTFYGQTLGVALSETPEGLALSVPGGGKVFIYPKPNHTPATFTVLNFQVNDLEKTVDGLIAAGIRFEQYSGELQTDEKGIFHGSRSNQGPDIAWFKDPAGNILSVVQVKQG
ncbi:VOC family protein [Compostibacter hankyongensis]|uniref:VOC family protein n=1 Tax=Compostibacter hankyongensis TaxID=1007089 RepID=A0ABP8FZ50_9BACT